MQRKTRRHIRFELSAQPHEKQHTWISAKRLHAEDWPFPRRIDGRRRISTRPYARIGESWVSLIGLNPNDHGTHSLRRTEVTLTYRQTNNLRAVQLLLGHTKLENTTRHLAIEVDDALEIAERTDV